MARRKKYAKCKQCGTRMRKLRGKHPHPYLICSACHEPRCRECGSPIVIERDEKGWQTVSCERCGFFSCGYVDIPSGH